MSHAVRPGEPLPLERRGAPAIAAGASLALHGALFLAAFAGWGVRPERPVLAAAKSELALSIARPAPPRPAERPAEEAPRPPRPVARTEALERVAAPRPETEDKPPSTPRIERKAAPPAAPARPEAEVLPLAAYDSAGGIRAPRRLGESKPDYPPGCQSGRHRAGGCEGTGRYEIEVDAEGRVLSAGTAGSAGCPHLDASAVRFLLRRARFEPAAMDGVPVPWGGVITVRFDLEEDGARASGMDAPRPGPGTDR